MSLRDIIWERPHAEAVHTYIHEEDKIRSRRIHGVGLSIFWKPLVNRVRKNGSWGQSLLPRRVELCFHPFRTNRSPLLGTNYFKFEWFVPKTGLRLVIKGLNCKQDIFCVTIVTINTTDEHGNLRTCVYILENKYGKEMGHSRDRLKHVFTTTVN